MKEIHSSDAVRTRKCAAARHAKDILQGIRQQHFVTILLLIVCATVAETWAQPYRQPQRCSNRLESALEQVRRRSSAQLVKASPSSRSIKVSPETPYTLYQSLYGQHDDEQAGVDDFYSPANDGGGGRGYYSQRMQRPSYADDRQWPSWEEQLSLLRRHRQPHKLSVARVDVEDLRVRLPPAKSAGRWVEVDKCRFSTENRTLDTRLIFPDLTISGRVVLQPTGGKCNMILRLRHAGIEFHTIPLGSGSGGVGDPHEETRRGSGAAAAVRTDSHFAEPGFISVFAHGCQGPTGIRLRQNSKRRYGFTGEQGSGAAAAADIAAAPEVELSEPQVVLGTVQSNRWGKYQHTLDRRYQQPTPQHPQQATMPFYDIRSEHQRPRDPEEDSFYAADRMDHFGDAERDRAPPYYHRRYKRHSADQQTSDEVHFHDDILNFDEGMLQDLVEPDARAFAELFSNGGGGAPHFSSPGGGNNLSTDRDAVDEAFSEELEKLFSMGVRSLLTTYMQRALQPAIKETLMENMGYTLSYG